MIWWYWSLSAKEEKRGLQMKLSDKTDIMQHQNNWSHCRFFSSAIADEASKYPYFDRKGRGKGRKILTLSIFQSTSLSQMIFCWFWLLCGTRCLSARAVPLMHALVCVYLIPTPSCAPKQLFMCFVLFS